jgi:hypothetical protein
MHKFRYSLLMVQLVYIDETGSTGRGANKQPVLTLAAVIVDEDKVQPLSRAMRRVAVEHVEWLQDDFEFHGQEIWNGTGPWVGKRPPELLAVYKAAIDLIEEFDLRISRSSINKELLHIKYNGAADDNSYLLALQFLLEKIDYGFNKILIADEAKEHQLRAIKMVADLQQWGAGLVPGRQLKNIIDSLHFVRSHASYGVQMADLVAFILQRSDRNREGHPDATAALAQLRRTIDDHISTWREPWPTRAL